MRTLILIALDTVVRMLLGVVKGVGYELFDDGFEGWSEIGDDLVGLPVSVERFTNNARGASRLRRGDTNTSMIWSCS